MGEISHKVEQNLKSKTNIAAILSFLLISIISHFGVEVPAEAAAGFVSIIMLILRQITKGAIEDK